LVGLVLVEEDHPVIRETHLLAQSEIDSRLPDVTGQWPLQVPPDTIKVVDLLAFHRFFVVIPQQARILQSKGSLTNALDFYQRIKIIYGPILMASDEPLVFTIQWHLVIPQQGLSYTTLRTGNGCVVRPTHTTR